MKIISVLLIVLLMISCSKPTSTETANESDSVQTDTTTTTYDAEEIGDEYEPEEEGEANEVDLEMSFDEASQLIMNGEESFYQVNISANGYESMSSISWYFDKEFSVRCYKQSWSMEGQEGSEDYYLRNDSVICVLEVESGGSGTVTTRVCRKAGGKKTTENYDQEPANELVPESYLDTKRKSIDDYLGQLISLLRGSEIEESEEGMYTIKIENVVDVGQEVTETTTVTIPKALYGKLLN